jgi:ribosomal peptide maturation radical SAM protein 1
MVRLMGSTSDNIPKPDYEDYFSTLKNMSYYNCIKNGILILLESSRGCWWNQCVFCGLNHFGKVFRRKKYEKILAEIIHFSEKYGIDNVEFVDNILPMHYFYDLIPALSKHHKKYNIFFETKANLDKEHVKSLAEANIKWIQPGIESLNDDMLSIMSKGTTTIANIRLLKYAIEYGVNVMWNLLINCPGEDNLWIEKMIFDLPLFHHLQPPQFMNHISFQRFSKYYNNSASYSLELRPWDSFKYIYPFNEKKLTNFAYYFQDAYHVSRSIENKEQYDRLDREILIWKKEFYRDHPATLIMIDNTDNINIIDSRNCVVEKNMVISGLDADIIRIAELGIDSSNILKTLNELHNKKYLNIEIDVAISKLENKKIIYEHNNILIALPVFKRSPLPPNLLDPIKGPDYSVYLKL